MLRAQPDVRVLDLIDYVEGRQTRSKGVQQCAAANRVHDVDRPWLFGRVPNGFWDVRENRVHYLSWLGETCAIRLPSHWYGVRKFHFENNGGGGLLRNKYHSSVLKAMLDFLPDFDWKPWLFGGAPTGFWKNPENRRRYLEWLAVKLNIRTTDEWYAVTGADFFAHHGGGLLNNEFNGSVQAVLQDYKPDYAWKAWRFCSVPQGYWNNIENRRSYLRWLGDSLGFVTQGDWNRVCREDFYDHHGAGVFVGHFRGSTVRAVQELFAEA